MPTAITTPKTKTVSLSELVPGDSINARQHGRKVGIDDLATSIKTIGLLHPLVVRAAPGGKGFEVIDGNRRLEALRKIVGKKGDMDVTVSIREDESAIAHEASLAANVMREQLHPADEYEAYQRMVDEGHTVESISQRFAQPEKFIRQRLQLAALAPELRQDWKAGKMTVDQAQAFSSVPDHELQRKVWKKVAKARDSWHKTPDAIRREMSPELIRQNSASAVFVGIDAYKDAGGRVSEDLFTDAQFLLDRDILDRLVAAGMQKVCDELTAEGWLWAMTEAQYREKFGLNVWQAPRLDVSAWMTTDEKAEFAKTKYSYEQDKASRAAQDRAEEDPLARAKSGVIIRLGHDGDLDLEMLRMLPMPAEDAGDETDAEDADDVDDDEDVSVGPVEPAAPEGPKISEPLALRLSEMMTMAVSEAIVSNTTIGIAAIIATIRLKTESYNDAPLRLSSSPWSGVAPQRDEARKGWSDYFAEAVDLSDHAQAVELARLSSFLIDLRDMKYDSSRGHDWKARRSGIVQGLAGALEAQDVTAAIAKHFDPTAYFSAVPAALIDSAMVEMGNPPAKGKKTEKVAAAVQAAKASGWLPIQMRTPHYTGPKGGEA